MINPEKDNSDKICSAAICYLFAKTLSTHNKDLATLAVIGMIGDNHGSQLNKTYDEITKDSEVTIKKGLMLYPSTRPINKALEYSSSPYIPGVTGNQTGVFELLREAGIGKENGGYKALYELTNEEMGNLITAITVRTIGKIEPEELIGNLYLVKFFNKMEDARELSASINACSRMDRPEVSLGLCLGSRKFKEEGEKIYIEYRQSLLNALKDVNDIEKIQGNKYTIINARDKIKDTIIGTVASIISHSPTYEKGTIIVALAYNQDKIKVSARIVGKENKNVREILNQVVVPLGGEVGGHPAAAGCLIERTHENAFIENLKRTLEIETVKI
jgi:RecJ-like exonuclease